MATPDQLTNAQRRCQHSIDLMVDDHEDVAYQFKRAAGYFNRAKLEIGVYHASTVQDGIRCLLVAFTIIQTRIATNSTADLFTAQAAVQHALTDLAT